MHPDKRQRLMFFALALLFHAVIFWLVCHLIVFSAPPVTEETTGVFTHITLPKVTKAPEVPTEAEASMPNLLPPTTVAPAPVVPIVTTMPSQFSLPKIDTTAAINETLAKLPTSHSEASTPSTGNTTSPGTSTGSGPGAACTSSYAVMESSLANDQRGGENIGIKYPSFHHREDGPLITAVTKEVPSIGWVNANRLTGFFAIVYQNQPRDPSLPPAPKSDDYEQSLRYADTETQVITAFFENEPELSASHIKIKTFIMVSNFEDSVENPRPGLQKATDNQIRDQIDRQVEMTSAFIADLRNRRIRLCVITLHYPPYDCIAAYVKESGGIVLFPNGVPLSQAAHELKDAATSK